MADDMKLVPTYFITACVLALIFAIIAIFYFMRVHNILNVMDLSGWSDITDHWKELKALKQKSWTC
jgi:hypothetical protein